jgi:hypothetical protein
VSALSIALADGGCSTDGSYPNNRYAVLVAFWLTFYGHGCTRPHERELWANLAVAAGIVFA